MQRFLVVIGLQPEKVQACGKAGRKILDWVQAHHDEYAVTISIIREYTKHGNLQHQGGDIITNNDIHLDYYTDQIIKVPGFDVDCTQFRRDVHYDIVGISTGASILCCALSMFSAGLHITVRTDLCCDRMGKKTHEAALTIMDAYMPSAVK